MKRDRFLGGFVVSMGKEVGEIFHRMAGLFVVLVKLSNFGMTNKSGN